MKRIEKIIEELKKSLTADYIQFDILDNDGNEVGEELEILNSKIDAITYLEAKGWDYKVSKIESVNPIGSDTFYHAEVFKIEVFKPNVESEYIFVYAKLRDTEKSTTEVMGWEISQSEFTGR